ncbi:MAG: outer membrane lipoprotein-sorting protein [Pseudomonadota bacterium]
MPLPLRPVLRCFALSTLIIAMLGQIGLADDASTRGLDIAARSDQSDNGFGDTETELKMILTNAAGESTTRELRITTLERANADIGDRSLVIFDRPRDIKGTALLSHSKILEPDDQWLFLPALKRTKRISSANKSGPFVGSEFAFEDITGQELNKYEYKWLREDACGEFMCDVLERIPRYENSGYTRQEAWYDQTHFQVRKIDYFDRKSALLKTQTFEDYRLYDGKYWRSHEFSVTNHQTGKGTKLIFSDYKFAVGLDDKDFVKGVLARQR